MRFRDIDVTVRRLVKYLSPGRGRDNGLESSNNGDEEKNGGGSKVTRRSARLDFARRRKKEEGTGSRPETAAERLAVINPVNRLVEIAPCGLGIFSRKFVERDCASPFVETIPLPINETIDVDVDFYAGGGGMGPRMGRINSLYSRHG